MVDHSDDVPRGTVLGAPAAAAGRWYAGGFSDEYGERVLWRSDDGARWRALPISAEVAVRAGPVVVDSGDRIVVFTSDGPLLTIQTSRGGTGWSEVDLGAAFAPGTTDYAVEDTTAADGSIAALVDTAGSTGATRWLVVSDDGRRWTASPLASRVPAGVARTAASITIADGAVLVASTTRTFPVPIADLPG
jgi:hypothetical protein